MKTNTRILLAAVLVFLSPAWPTFAGNFFAGVSPTNVPIPGGVVHYQFDPSLTTAEQQTYLDGLREWELAADIHFVPHAADTNWILFKYAAGTSIDTYDTSAEPWTMTINVLSRSQICHEMGHLLGLAHENIRIDKTNYITVLSNNVSPPSTISYFNVDPTTVPYGPYDFESVMHLGNNFSSIDPSNLYTQVANHPYEKYQHRMGNWAISAGDRAAMAYLYGSLLTPLTNVVTTTSDAGQGSLRAALYYGIDHPGSTIRFAIPTNDANYSHGVYTIYLTGFLPPMVADGTIIDGTTQPGFSGKPLIVIDGSQMIPEAYIPDTATGLLMYAANCQVKNLSFQNFNWNGITLTYGANSNTISGCWCGVDYSGSNAAPNAYQGILVYNGASANVIGGTTALSRNVLSGNSGYGVYIMGTNTVGNSVQGSYISTDATGSNSLANMVGGAIITGGAYSNYIGGSVAGAGNLLSGNVDQFGLWIDSSNNAVQGNWIGLDASGTAALPNDFGVFIVGGATSNLVVSNVISGNYAEGIRFANPGTSQNLAQGNFIGTDAPGLNAVPNGFGGLTFFDGASSNTVGGLTAAARNVISGNDSYGVVVGDTNTTGNIVEGNWIGLSANGSSALPNGTGIMINNGAGTNIIGGATGAARNIVSGNSYPGIYIRDPGTSGNLIEGNYCGTGVTGSTALANGYDGLELVVSASSNIISGNVLSANGGRGVYISDTNTAFNWLQGNIIGLAADGVTPLGNSYEGVILLSGAQSNIVGLTTSGAGTGNRIAFSGYDGVGVFYDGTVGNTIRGNTIFSNNYLGINLSGGSENFYGVTANDLGDADTGANNLQNYPVITNAVTSGASTIISGTLNSVASHGFIVDVYRNTVADPSGNGEGQFYVGSVNVTTSGTGNAAFSLTTSGNFAGQYFTATATDSSAGNTSEFGADVVATNGPVPPSFTGSFTYGGTGFSANVSVTSGQTYHVQSTTNLALSASWTNTTNFTASGTNYSFQDHSATNARARFYRVISP